MSRVLASMAVLVLAVLAAPPAAVAAGKRTVLLLPFASAFAGFETSVTIANTTADPFGEKTVSGPCTINYFPSIGTAATQTTNGDVVPGDMLTFSLSNGGSHGIQGRPGFQGYVIFDCAFPHAVGTAYLATGAFLQNAASVPVTEIKPKDRK